MVSVPEAARRLSLNPETIRRWIRAGKLPAHKVGTQHFIDEGDLDAVAEGRQAPLPSRWAETVTGEPMPDWVQALRRSRAGH